MKRAGEDITDRHREEVKKWVDAYNGMKKKIDFVAGKIAELKQNLSSPIDHKGYVQIHDRCFPGTVITLYDVAFPISAEYVNKRFCLKNQSVAIEGLASHEQSK